MQLTWDIFCTVVDNYGDIGVCWRLARQLAHERGEAVRLWVNDLNAFATLRPDLNPTLTRQMLDAVEVWHWSTDFPAITPHQVVIEAFACNPAPAFVQAMAAMQPKPVWINLDYLSAEDWVEGCHGLGSPHPRLPLRHHFFFPGFTAATGGLLREAGLLAEREAWQADGARTHAWLRTLGLQDSDLPLPRRSLFCYDNPALPALLRYWQDAAPSCLLVADGKPRRQLADWLGEPFTPGSRIQRGALTLIALPFLSQTDYDRLLWSCDFNFIRGEDSFVRAQWAARPMCWHIYAQDEDAHLLKLAAFLQRYLADLAPAEAEAVHQFWLAWNQADGPASVVAWQILQTYRAEQLAHARRWCAQLASQPDLMQQLAHFASEKLAAMR